MDSTNTTKRSKPFTQLEKDELLIVLSNYSKIIENKQTDATSLKKKNDAWISVCKEYNSNGEVTQRSMQQLKRAWETLKNIQKKTTIVVVAHAKATGGGTAMPEPAPNPLIEVIAPHATHFVKTTQDSDALWLDKLSTQLPPGNEAGCSNAATIAPLVFAEATLEDTTDSEGPPESPRSAADRTPSRKRSRLTILSEEHGERMSQLTADVGRQTELHELRILEAKAALEAARFKAKREQVEYESAKEERLFQQERRRLELGHMRAKMDLELKRLGAD